MIKAGLRVSRVLVHDATSMGMNFSKFSEWQPFAYRKHGYFSYPIAPYTVQLYIFEFFTT